MRAGPRPVQARLRERLEAGTAPAVGSDDITRLRAAVDEELSEDTDLGLVGVALRWNRSVPTPRAIDAFEERFEELGAQGHGTGGRSDRRPW